MLHRLPALVAALLALLALFSPAIASPDAAAEAKSGVGAFKQLAGDRAGGRTSEGPAKRQGSAANSGQIASAYLVAARGAPGSLSNVEARRWYHDRLAEIPGQIDSSLPIRDRALQAFSLRNRAKLEARGLMADRAAAGALPPPSSLQDVVRKTYQEKGLTGDAMWSEIYRSSARTNPSVDRSPGF